MEWEECLFYHAADELIMTARMWEAKRQDLSIVLLSRPLSMGIRGDGGLQPLNFFQIAIFGPKIGNIRAKLLDFRASNGKNIRPRDFSPPPPPPPRTKLVPHAYNRKWRSSDIWACYLYFEGAFYLTWRLTPSCHPTQHKNIPTDMGHIICIKTLQLIFNCINLFNWAFPVKLIQFGSLYRN